MTRWLWFDGRFAWPFVSAVVFLSVALLFADLAWRMLVLSAETLLMLMMAAGIVILLGLAGLWFLLQGRRRLN